MRKEKEEDIANVMEHYIRIYKTIQYARYAGTDKLVGAPIEFKEQIKHVNKKNARQIREGIEERIRNNPSKRELLSGLKRQVLRSTNLDPYTDFICMQEGKIDLRREGYIRYGGNGDCSIYAFSKWTPIIRSEIRNKPSIFVKGQPKGYWYTRGFTDGNIQVQVVSMHLPSTGNTPADDAKFQEWRARVIASVRNGDFKNKKEFEEEVVKGVPYLSVYAQACNILNLIASAVPDRAMICCIDTNTKHKFDDTVTVEDAADTLFRSDGDNRDLTELVNPWWPENYVQDDPINAHSKTMNELQQLLQEFESMTLSQQLSLPNNYIRWLADHPNRFHWFVSQGPTVNKTRSIIQFQTKKTGKLDYACKDVILVGESKEYHITKQKSKRWIGTDTDSVPLEPSNNTLPVLPNKNHYSDHAWVIATVNVRRYKPGEFDKLVQNAEEKKIREIQQQLAIEKEEKEIARLEQERKRKEAEEQQIMEFRKRLGLDQKPSTSTSTSLRPGDRTFRFLDE